MTTSAAIASSSPSIFCPSCGHNLAAEQAVTIGALSFDPRGEVLWSGSPIKFTCSQFLLFGALMQARGKLVSKDVLAERAGYDGLGDAHDVVQVLVCRIRGALRSVGCPPTIIRTVRARGCAIDTGLLLELEGAR